MKGEDFVNTRRSIRVQSGAGGLTAVETDRVCLLQM